jgi:hypothetical protein
VRTSDRRTISTLTAHARHSDVNYSIYSKVQTERDLAFHHVCVLFLHMCNRQVEYSESARIRRDSYISTHSTSLSSEVNYSVTSTMQLERCITFLCVFIVHMCNSQVDQSDSPIIRAEYYIAVHMYARGTHLGSHSTNVITENYINTFHMRVAVKIFIQSMQPSNMSAVSHFVMYASALQISATFKLITQAVRTSDLRNTSTLISHACHSEVNYSDKATIPTEFYRAFPNVCAHSEYAEQSR